jgi:hypothetical protein
MKLNPARPTANPPASLRAPIPSNSQPRLALRPSEAAAALGLSDESFDRYVRPELPVVRLGTMRLYRVEVLDAWLREHSSPPPIEDVGG